MNERTLGWWPTRDARATYVEGPTHTEATVRLRSASPRCALRLLLFAARAAFGARALTRARRGFRYRDKLVLITGGSRGLGLGLARELAARGA